jgi:hypothetical protein
MIRNIDQVSGRRGQAEREPLKVTHRGGKVTPGSMLQPPGSILPLLRSNPGSLAAIRAVATDRRRPAVALLTESLSR